LRPPLCIAYIVRLQKWGFSSFSSYFSKILKYNYNSDFHYNRQWFKIKLLITNFVQNLML
jgi:hypothetical protein